jgi:ribulose-phosphate 3-epimerase
MIEEPSRYIADFVSAGANWISVHVETEAHLNRTVNHIQERGARAGVALNPGTPLSALEEILPEVDFVLVMSVNPGFGGQKFIPSSLNKIRKLRELITSNGYRAQIEVDGGIGTSNLHEVLAAGAEIIVAGSAIFRKNSDAVENVREFKRIADSHTHVLETT